MMHLYVCPRYEILSPDGVHAQANHQLDGALEFLSALGAEPLDPSAFEEASGVGVEVSQH
jgi:Glutaminyl-tRNA synthetase, non-specific RNA binding region part 1